MKKRNDVNDSIKVQRIKTILELMGKGHFMFEIVDKLTKDWNCSSRNVYKYITKAKEVLKKDISERDKEDLINQFDILLQKAYEKGDYKLINSILANKGKFTVGEKSNVEHSGSISGININLIDGIKPPSE